MKPYREILNFVVAYIAEIRSSVIGRGLEPDVALLFGVLRFAPEVCPQKPVSRLIAYAFILDHYCAQMCTATMAIWRINLSVPSTAFSRSAYFTPLVVPFLGPQNLIDLHPAVNFS
jgi:hypothetical protein